MIAGTLELQLFANMARLQSDMNEAKRMVGGAMGSIESAVGSAKAALGALGIGLSIGYFVNLVKGSIDAADHLNDLTKYTGISIEQLSGLKLAAQQSGGDLESIAASLNKLSINMGKDAEKFAALGVTAKDPLEAFKQLSDIFVQIQDPQQRAAVMAEALGKSWAGAAPLLAEGSAKIQEMVDKGSQLSKVTPEMARQADAFNDSMATLKATIGGVTTEIIGRALPGMNQIAVAMAEAAKQGGILNAVFVGFGGAMTAVFTDDLLSRPQQIAKSLKSLQKDLDAETSGWARWMNGLSDTSKQRSLEQINRLNERMLALNKELAGIQELEAKSKAANAGMTDAEKKAAAEQAARAAEFLKAAQDKKDAYDAIKKHADDYIKTLEKETEQFGLDAVGKKIHESYLVSITLKTEKEREAVMNAAAAWAKKALAENDAKLATEAATKAEEELQKQLESGTETYSKYWNSVDESTAKINENAAKLEFENTLIGKTADQISRLTGVRDDEAISVLDGTMAVMRSNDAKVSEVTAIAQQIEALYRLKAAREQKPMLEAAAKQVEEETKLRVDMWKNIDSVARDTFVNIWGHGKSTLDRLRDTLKNGLLAMLYEMGKKQFLINVGVAGGGIGATDSAMAGGMGGSAGDLSSMIGAGGFIGELAGGISGAMSGGILSGVQAGISMIGLPGGFASGMGLMLPGIGIAAAGIAAVYSLLKGNGGTPTASTGYASMNFDAQGNSTRNPTLYGVSNAATDSIVMGLQSSYMKAAMQLGIGTVATNFAYASNTGKDGKGNNFGLSGNGFVQGETAYSSEAVQLAASRAVFAALKGSDLPAYLSNLFNGLTADTATQAQIDGVMAFAATLKTLRDSLTETRTPLEVATAQMATLAGDLHTSASTFKTDFVAAIDGGITPETLGKWQTLGVLIDQTTAAQVTAAEEHARIVAEAAAKEKAVMEERMSWQQKLDILLGKTTQQEIDRAALLAGATDETTKLIMQQVFAEQDRQAALNASTSAVQTATTAIKTMTDTLSIGWGEISNSAQSAVDTVMNLTGFSGAKYTTRSSAQMTALQELIAQSEAAMVSTRGHPGATGAERLRLEEIIKLSRNTLGTLTEDMARYVTLEAQYAGHGEQLLNLEKWYNEQKALFEQNHLSTNTLQAEYERQRLEIIKSGNTAALDAMKQLSDWLKGLGGNSALSPLSPAQQQAEAMAKYEKDLKLAQGGDAAAIGRLSREAEAVLAAQKSVSGFGGDYSAMYNRIRAEIEALTTQIKPTETIQPMLSAQSEGNKTAADSLTELRAVRAELADTRATLARLLERGNAAVAAQTGTLGAAITGAGDKTAKATTNAALLAAVN